LAAAREKLPDVDYRFASNQRGRVLQWLIKRHGADHVARVGTFSHLRAVSSLKAAMKLHGLSDEQVKAVRQPLGELDSLADPRLGVVPPRVAVRAGPVAEGTGGGSGAGGPAPQARGAPGQGGGTGP